MTERIITLEEVRKHKTAESCWIVIHNKVYDVTKFMDEHPGGEAVLLEQAGGYATEAFEDVGHSSDARTLMKDYYIGEIDKKDQESSQMPSHTGAGVDQGSGLSKWTGLVIPIAVAFLVVMVYKYYLS